VPPTAWQCVPLVGTSSQAGMQTPCHCYACGAISPSGELLSRRRLPYSVAKRAPQSTRIPVTLPDRVTGRHDCSGRSSQSNESPDAPLRIFQDISSARLTLTITLPVYGSHEVRHTLANTEGAVNAIALCLPVLRVGTSEYVGLVVALPNVEPIQVRDLGANPPFGCLVHRVESLPRRDALRRLLR